MKRILITGKNSYVGNSFGKWLENYPGKYEVDKISLRDGSWKEISFSSYDVVVHVAGIAHRKETADNKELYYKVNRDLAFDVANKAKQEGVSHFIFLSSMSVYGMETGIIHRDTVPNPKSNYGKSKLEAEKLIEPLNDDSFKVAILRPPMIYGNGCKGNYVRLSKLAVKSPIFPDINNKRSMIYIDNLSEFIRLLIDDMKEGMFFPQNDEYVRTSEMVNKIAKANGKDIKLTSVFNPLIKLINVSLINKVFGDLVYEKSISQYEKNYIVEKFSNSIYLTESGESNAKARI